LRPEEVFEEVKRMWESVKNSDRWSVVSAYPKMDVANRQRDRV